MTKRTSAKYKIDRRMGENIWGRPKSPVNKREYGPGQHGQRRKGKMSRLRHAAARQAEAQGLLRRPDRKAVPPHLRRRRAAARRHLRALIGLLERRLDAVVYRAKFVPTIFAARQFVNHGHVAVNGKRVNIASYRVKEGDVVEVREKSRQMALVLEAIGSPERDVPEYLERRPLQADGGVRPRARRSATCPIR